MIWVVWDEIYFPGEAVHFSKMGHESANWDFNSSLGKCVLSQNRNNWPEYALAILKLS